MLLSGTHANAITFGEEVLSAADEYPSTISIWYSKKPSDEPQFICSGTLIEVRVVLTAAHCVKLPGFFFVKYGANQLNDDLPLNSVSAVWAHPGYSQKQNVNDLGLLLLARPIPNARVMKLQSSSAIKNSLAKKNVKLQIAGWGIDQNQEQTTHLRIANVDNQSSLFSKYKSYRADVWFPVGKYKSKEKVYAGACNGDSGGPLFAINSGQYVQVGVTSWGAEDCEMEIPTFYVRLSYYADYLKKTGLATLYSNEKTDNRTLPEVVIEPSIVGSATPNNFVTCDAGKWSSSTLKVSTTWKSGFNSLGTTPTLRIPASEIGSYTCLVEASNKNGTITKELEIELLGMVGGTTQPTISNVPKASNYNSDARLTCTPAVFAGFSEITQSWWLAITPNKPEFKIGEGEVLSLSTSQLSNFNGKQIYCFSHGSTNNRRMTSFDKVTLDPIPAPVVSDTVVIAGMPKSGYEVGSSNNLFCTGGSHSGNVTTSGYSWLLRENSYATTGTIIGQGPSITLTSDWFKQNNFKDLVCKFTATGPGGSVYAQASGTVYAQSLPSAPSVSMTGFPSYGSNNQDAYVDLMIKCEASSYISGVTAAMYSYEWRMYDNPPYYPTSSTPSTPISTGQTLKLTSALLNQALFKRIGCAATLNLPAGSATAYSTSQYIDTRNITIADNAAPSVSFISATPSGSLRFSDYLLLKWSATDATDLSASSFTFRIVGPGNLDQTGVVSEVTTLTSGNAKSGFYEKNFRFPTKNSAYPEGDYKFYMTSCDSKYNCTPMTLVYSVSVGDSGGNALVTSKTLQLDSGSSGAGAIYSMAITVSNSNYSQINYSWYTSDRPEPATNSGQYRPVDFGTVSVNALSNSLTLTESMYSAVKGKYLVCRVLVSASSNYSGTSVGEAKILVP